MAKACREEVSLVPSVVHTKLSADTGTPHKQDSGAQVIRRQAVSCPAASSLELEYIRLAMT